MRIDDLEHVVKVVKLSRADARAQFVTVLVVRITTIYLSVHSQLEWPRRHSRQRLIKTYRDGSCSNQPRSYEHCAGFFVLVQLLPRPAPLNPLYRISSLCPRMTVMALMELKIIHRRYRDVYHNHEEVVKEANTQTQEGRPCDLLRTRGIF